MCRAMDEGNQTNVAPLLAQLGNGSEEFLNTHIHMEGSSVKGYSRNAEKSVTANRNRAG